MNDRKVILLGESHYHGLGLVRAFGAKGLRPFGILIGPRTGGYVEASRYWARIDRAETDEEAVELLLRLYGSEAEKPLVLPWSDGILAALDGQYDRLKDRFILASIRGEQGGITAWMNKEKQMELARALQLPVSPAETAAIPLTEADAARLSRDLALPVFVKPVDSREGTKKDMRRLDTWDAQREYAAELEEKGYRRILVQEYLNIEQEYDFMGVCCGDRSTYTLAEKTRIWPSKGGAASCGRTVAPEDPAFFEGILKRLSDFGYAGPFDMDIFRAGGRLYFNEINWRSSANVYGAVAAGNNYPWDWYVLAGDAAEAPALRSGRAGCRFMNGIWDIRHVLHREVSPFRWLADALRANAHAFWSVRDPGPFFARLTGSLRRKG